MSSYQRTKAANRFQANRQIHELTDRLGVQVVAKHFLVEVSTIMSWRNEAVPKSRCVELDQYHREVFCPLTAKGTA